jgi:hypothetical protein
MKAVRLNRRFPSHSRGGFNLATDPGVFPGRIAFAQP